MDVSWHDAYLAFVGLDDSRAVRADDSGLVLGSKSVFDFDHIVLGDA